MQTRAEVAATLPLLAPPQGHPYGYMNPRAWGGARSGRVAATSALVCIDCIVSKKFQVVARIRRSV